MSKTARWMPALLLLGALLLPVERATAQTAGQAAASVPSDAVAGVDMARRAAILATLDRVEVRRIAGPAGLDLDAARASVEALEGEALARAALQAGELDRRLAIDGAISSTTLILLLILTILIIVLLQS